jgi:soluble cytochrome b562
LEHILNDLIATYHSANEINWDVLPQKFVLKWNFSNGGNIICSDKSKLDRKQAIKELNRFQKIKPHLKYAEPQYDVEKVLLCEKFIETQNGEAPVDYKFYCFNGEAKYVLCCYGRSLDHRPAFYFFDKDWHLQRFNKMGKEAPEGFTYVVRNGFPSLRCTNYTVIFTVRPFTIEESEAVFETKPIYLNLNEIYRLADKYADNQEKYYSIMRKASLLYPNDTYVNLTMAFLAIKRQNVEEATEYLNKVKDCPQKTMNQGLIAYLTGDLDKAVQLVQQANLQGVQEAAEQLKEFDKLIQYNNKNKKNNQ